MKCPQCGSEFEAVVEQCFTCGWEFGQKPEDFKPRTSKLAVLTLILGILCLVTFYLPLLAAIVVGAVALRKIRKSRGRLTGERIAITGILIPVLSLPIIPVIGYAVWSKDAGPVPNEFTEADLVQVRPENEISWKLLLQLNDEPDDPNGAPAIGLTKEDVGFMEFFSEPNSVEKRFLEVQRDAETIMAIWERSQKGWDVIRELNTYDQIADLAKPDFDAKEVIYYDLKQLVKISHLYGLMLTSQGDARSAIEPVMQLYAVTQKLGHTSRNLTMKLVCYAIFDAQINTLNYILNYSNTSKGTVEFIRNSYSSDLSDLLGLRNCFVFEYLLYKNETNKPDFSRKHSLFKINSFLRYKDNYLKEMIKKDSGYEASEYCLVSVWPWESPNWPKVRYDEFNFYSPYFLYNPMGYIIAKKVPEYEKIFQIKTKILIKDDLFRWTLALRLGAEGSLKARAYSDEYTVDVEKGLVFSVGPDGQAYTDDDIKLPIDPAVLRLK